MVRNVKNNFLETNLYLIFLPFLSTWETSGENQKDVLHKDWNLLPNCKHLLLSLQKLWKRRIAIHTYAHVWMRNVLQNVSEKRWGPGPISNRQYKYFWYFNILYFSLKVKCKLTRYKIRNQKLQKKTSFETWKLLITKLL